MTDAPALAPARRSFVPRGLAIGTRWGELLGIVAAAAVPLIVALLVIDPWGHFSTVPWYYGGAVPSIFRFDVNFHLMAVKGLLETGWWTHNPALGAPFGAQWYDFPLGGYDVQLLLLKLIGIGPSSVGTVVNLYYLLTFPLTGLGAYAAFRLLHVSRPSAVVVASLFAVLPYHFLRGEFHLFLSLYATAAFGAYLVLALLLQEALFVRRAAGGRGLLVWASGRTIATLAICVLVGSTEYYYANLSMVLLVVATLIAFAMTRRWATLLKGGVLVAAIAATLTLNLAPALIHTAEHGKNTVAGKRPPSESAVFSLNLGELVLPSPFHRIPSWARLGQRYVSKEVSVDEQTASLGIVGTAGLAWLFAVTLLGAAGALRARPWLDRHRKAGAAALAAFLVATTGGVSSLVAYLVTAQIRAWNRMSLFIAFFALFAVALGLDALGRRLALRARRGALLFAAALLAVLVIGALDETSTAFRPNYTLAADQFGNDARFVHAIEARVPPGTMVFQEPYIAFPESLPRWGMIDYDLGKGYISSHTLRWSYGGIKGRPQSDWQAKLADRPMSTVLPAVVAVGFRGLYIDRNGYADGGRAIVRDATRVAGVPPLVSQDQRLYFFDLRPYAARVAARLGPAGLAQLRHTTLGAAAQ